MDSITHTTNLILYKRSYEKADTYGNTKLWTIGFRDKIFIILYIYRTFKDVIGTVEKKVVLILKVCDFEIILRTWEVRGC